MKFIEKNEKILKKNYKKIIKFIEKNEKKKIIKSNFF